MTNIKKYKILFKDLMRLLNVSSYTSSINKKIKGRTSSIHSTTFSNTDNLITNLVCITIYEYDSDILGFQFMYKNNEIFIIEDHIDTMIEKIKIVCKHLRENVAGVETQFTYFKEFIKPDKEFIKGISLKFEDDIKKLHTTRMDRNFRTFVHKKYSIIVRDDIKYKFDEVMKTKDKMEKIMIECDKLAEEYSIIKKEYYNLYDEKMNEYSHDNIVELVKDEEYLTKVNIVNYNNIEKYKYILDPKQYNEIRNRLI